MSRMSELDLMIREQYEPLHDRVLALQKEVRVLKNAAYADHRLMEKMYRTQNQLTKRIHKLETDT